MPIVCTFYVVIIKYVNDNLRLASYDFTIAYWGIMALVYEVFGAVSYAKVGFDLELWVYGFFASLLNLLGCVFMIACFSTGAPMGPSSALVSTQTIIVTVVTAIVSREAPSWM
jgi:drug/metabolite transporter (DMT)-like permease